MFAFRIPAIRRCRPLAVLLAAGVLSACTATFRDHGYVPSEEDLSQIVVGVDTRDSVAETVGVPTTSGVLRDDAYYYVSSRVRTFALREPQVVDRKLVAIGFDGSGVVRNIERYGLQDGIAVPLEREITDSGLRDQTFLRQLLGNLGRFSPGALLE